ncbi:MAG TPA: Ig-like domain-containing protein [Candidatus Saccharimonadales bacterium]|nr:Ig-like domain-containing protein [Candidatus Saccharimonadales bacterium]
MKLPALKRHRWKKSHHYLPVVTHVVELAVGLAIIAGGQNLFAELVGADPDITPPSVPANLSLSARSPDDIEIGWDASTDDVGVTGYHVYRDGVEVGAPTGNDFDDTGLDPNTHYDYTVSAFDDAGNESDQSDILAVTTLADTSAPSVPGHLHQTGSTIDSVSIAWDDSADNVGVTGYDIYRNGSLIRTQPETDFTDSGLAVYTNYTYTITAHDAEGNTSNLSQPLYAATDPDTTPPSIPDNLQETGSSVDSIDLSWDDSTDDVGVTGYNVFRDGAFIGTTGGNTYTDTGLDVSSSYAYTVSAFDGAANESNQSTPFFANSSDDTTPPTIPANLRTTDVKDDSISLAWDDASDDVAVVGYAIYRDGSLIGTSTDATYTDSGLDPFTDYSYKVQAYDAANNSSADSAQLDTQTAYDTTNPTVPTNLASDSQTDTTISLTWDDASDNISVESYDVYRDGNLITNTTGTNFTDTGLDVDTSYSYTVRANDGSGNNSDQSDPLDVSTLTDQIAPDAPANLTSTGQTETSVDLTWDSADDDVSVTGYKVYRNGSFVEDVTDTNYTDDHLHYNTAYSYTVTAVDAAGNESVASDPYDVSTLPDTTAPTVSLTNPTDGQTKALTFSVSATASDDLALSKVVFYADSTQIASLTHAPFAFNWNSYAVHNGSHIITAKAFDASGNFSSDSATVTINNPPPPISGDLNADHKVNIFDLSILLSHWGGHGSGDFNKNGRVDIFDLSVLLSHWGQDNSGYH